MEVNLVCLQVKEKFIEEKIILPVLKNANQIYRTTYQDYQYAERHFQDESLVKRGAHMILNQKNYSCAEKNVRIFD